MKADEVLLLTLQHGDSFFPSGAVSFSWGLEGLHRDGLVGNASELQGFLEGQLLGRWATCDRPALVAAYRAFGDLEEVAAVDAALHALTLPEHLREGSRRCGSALLTVHQKLATPQAADYRAMVRSGEAKGHLAAIQGLLFGQIEIPESAIVAISAHTMAAALLSAAVRLGIVGHIDGQRILTNLRPLILEIAAEEPSPNLDSLSSYMPATEIAVMRHETRDVRLFFN